MYIIIYDLLNVIFIKMFPMLYNIGIIKIYKKYSLKFKKLQINLNRPHKSLYSRSNPPPLVGALSRTLIRISLVHQPKTNSNSFFTRFFSVTPKMPIYRRRDGCRKFKDDRIVFCVLSDRFDIYYNYGRLKGDNVIITNPPTPSRRRSLYVLKCHCALPRYIIVKITCIEHSRILE